MQQAVKRLRVIRWLLIGQLTGALAAGGLGFFWSAGTAKAALIGGLIVWLPNCYFAFRAFRYRGARAARLIVRSFYAGAFGKMILTALLFALVFSNVRPLNALALFAGFLGVQSLSFFIPLIMGRLDNRQVSTS